MRRMNTSSVLRALALVLLVLAAAQAVGKKLKGTSEERYVTVVEENEYSPSEVDVTGLVLGEDFMPDFNIPWNGEDTIHYAWKYGLLYVNGKAVGADFDAVSFEDIPDPDDIIFVSIPFLEDLRPAWFPNLKGLNAENAADSEMVLLKRFGNLRMLALRYGTVTDSGLVHLKGLTGLRELDLTYTLITDAGLAHLKDLSKLRVLNLT